MIGYEEFGAFPEAGFEDSYVRVISECKTMNKNKMDALYIQGLGIMVRPKVLKLKLEDMA